MTQSARELYTGGIRLFNAEQFYECHDTLEELWLEDSSSDRLFYQGLIQVAVAYYHLTGGKLGAARSMMEKALEKLAQYPEHHRGVDLGALNREVAQWKEMLDDCIRRGAAPASRAFPRIAYDPAADMQG